MSGRNGEQRLWRAAAVVAVVAAVSLPALAGAGQSTRYAGKFSNSAGTVSYKLERVQGKRLVTRWKWAGFPVLCADGTQLSQSKYLFNMRVRNRAFKGRAVRRDGDKVVGGAKVTGTFERGYASASGDFRVWGEVPGQPEPHQECAGTDTWNATEAITPAR